MSYYYRDSAYIIIFYLPIPCNACYPQYSLDEMDFILLVKQNPSPVCLDIYLDVQLTLIMGISAILYTFPLLVILYMAKIIFCKPLWGIITSGIKIRGRLGVTFYSVGSKWLFCIATFFRVFCQFHTPPMSKS